MSVWTHVSGSIRIGSITTITGENDEKTKEAIEKRLGKIVRWESPEEDWDLPEEEKTPTGSEGGIEYEYLVPPTIDPHAISRGTITFHGDLRSFEESDTPKIEAWLARAFKDTNEEGFWIRQGAILVETEYGKSFFLKWNTETNVFDKILIK